MKFLTKKFIVIYVALIVLLYLVIYTIPGLTGLLTSTYTLEYGNLKVYDETVGYIVRNEKVYLADKSGQINRLIKDGTLTRKGTKIIEISGDPPKDSKAFDEISKKLIKNGATESGETTLKSGILSYNVDGFEGSLTEDTMISKKESFFKELEDYKVQSLKRSETSSSQPVFRIVDQSIWHLVTYVDKSNSDRYPVDKNVTIEVIKGKDIESFVGTVIYNKDESGRTKIIVRTSDLYDGFANERSIKINIVASNQSGLVILNKSIEEEDGKKGLFVKNKLGKYTFVPIRIISSDGTKSIVAKNFFYDEDGNMINTVKAYDIVRK